MKTIVFREKSKFPRAEALRYGDRRGIFFALFAVILLLGCQIDDDTGNLHGTWINVYDPGGENEFTTTIIINSSAKTIEYADSYEGEIINSPDFSAVNGVLIIKFTKYCDFMYPPPISTHSNVNKFGALYWRELTIGSVLMADAYDGLDHLIFDTIEEAQTAFTIDKANNYVDWSYVGTYTK